MRATTLSVGVTGPLASYAGGFAEKLRERGYTEVSGRHQLGLLASLDHWLETAGLEPPELTTAEVSRFLLARREAAPTGRRTERALRPLLDYLRQLGAVPEWVFVIPDSPLERLLERYRGHLVRERGLARRTMVAYESFARLFLDGRATADGLDLMGLNASDVTSFVLRESRKRGVGSGKYLVTGLRSLLRFLHMEGTAPALAGVVPGVAGWRADSLPRALDRTQVTRLLDSCDRGTSVGCRDYAMLTLLVRLGLRAGEVTALELADFDWRRGEVG